MNHIEDNPVENPARGYRPGTRGLSEDAGTAIGMGDLKGRPDVPNPSGINPIEFKVLILPSPVEEVTKGGIIKPVETTEKDKYATMDGIIVAISRLAFTYAEDDQWGDDRPKVGDTAIFAKYSGLRRKGVDGIEYLIVNDKDIVATVAK